MTVLDRTVEFKKVLMVIARNTIKKEVPLKDGYRYVKYDKSIDDKWIELHMNTCMFESKEDAGKALDSMLEQDEGFFKNNFLFVEDEKGKLVASAGLWPGKDFDDKRLRLHYVSVSQDAQHNKIAQSMITRLCMMYDKKPSKYPLYLATQSQSYGAIALYSKLGFTPYFGEYRGSRAKDSEEAWTFTTEIMKHKAIKH